MKKQVFRDSYAPKIRRLCSKCRKGGLMITGSCPLFRITHSWQHPRFSFLSAGARSVWSVKEKIKSRVLLSFVVGIVCAYTWLKATLVYQKWYNLHILAFFVFSFCADFHLPQNKIDLESEKKNRCIVISGVSLPLNTMRALCRVLMYWWFF